MSQSMVEFKEKVFALMRRLRAMDDVDYLQSLIAYHAAPTLQGVKPATLLCPGAGWRDLEKALRACGPRLWHAFGVKIASFRNHAGALLLLVYKPYLLRTALAAREVVELLAEAGYDAATGCVETLLDSLGEKCSARSFPHEIGVFLGYPAGDVRRFMCDGGKGCRAVGCWKAYGDADAVDRKTDRYRRIRLRAAEMIVNGADLREMAAGLREAV